MQTDIYGSEVSLSDPAALSHWNALQQAFLAHAAVAPDHLGKTLAAAPDFALGHAVKGLFMLMLGRRELMQTARDALQAARQGHAGTPRETLYVEALADWLAGAPRRAAARIEQVFRTHPGDALAMKISHAIRFILGDRHGMLRALTQVRPAYGSDHPALGYLHGCRSFALEENGEYDLARRAGITAMDLASDDAWGLHAVAHVYDMTGDSAAGLKWLDGNTGGWEHCNNFRYHVWWHKALMHLDQGDVDTVFQLYDTQIRQDRTDDYRDISNATSLLMRLELDGYEVGDRWEELADLSAARTEDGCLIFADLHYLLALIGDDRPEAAQQLVARIARDGARGESDADQSFAAPGVAAAEGLEAFAEGAYRRAFQHLSKARPAMQHAGGSHAQRDVFERITIDAGIRAGELDRAEAILLDRGRRRGDREDGYTARRRALIADLRRPTLALSAE